jgi:hypothetical protein
LTVLLICLNDLYSRKFLKNSSSRACGKCGKVLKSLVYQGSEPSTACGKPVEKVGGFSTDQPYYRCFSTGGKKFSTGFPQGFPQKMGGFPQVFCRENSQILTKGELVTVAIAVLKIADPRVQIQGFNARI